MTKVFVAVTVAVAPLPTVTWPGVTTDAFAPPAPGSVTSQTDPTATSGIVVCSGRRPPRVTSPSHVVRLPEASSSVHVTWRRNGPAPKSGAPSPSTTLRRSSEPMPNVFVTVTVFVGSPPVSGVSTTVVAAPASGPVVPPAVVVVTVVDSAPFASVSVTAQLAPAGSPVSTSEPPSARSAVIGVPGPYPAA